MKLKLKSTGVTYFLFGLFLLTLLAQTMPAETVFTNEFWISTVVQTNGGANGVYGNGTLDCPYDGSTQTKFDSVMHFLSYDAYLRFNITIHLLAGTYQTLQTSWQINGWRLQSGQKLLGSGIDNTIIQLATNAPSGSYVIGCYPLYCSNIEVADLTLNCNYTGGTFSYGGMGLEGTGGLVAKRVKVINVAGADPNYEVVGIAFNCGGIGSTNNSDGNIIEECEVDAAPGQNCDGLAFYGSPTQWISGIMRNNRIVFSATTGSAINCAWMRNTLIEGNYVEGGTSGFYGDTGGYTNILMAHNVFENCGVPVFIANVPRQNLMFCYNTISSTTSNGVAWAFRFDSLSSYTNIAIIGNTVTFNGNTPVPGSQFLWVNNIAGLIVANNMVDPGLGNSISGCTGINMYLNYDLNGNLRTDLDTMGFSTMTTYGRSLMSSASSSAALVNLGLPSNPTILLTTNQSLPVSFATNVTVSGALNYSNMVAQLLAGTGITTSTMSTSTGRVVTVNANSQTNGFGNIVTHGTGEFAAATNATIWNSVTVTNPTAPNWSMLSVSSSNAVLSLKGVNVAILQTNGVFNVPSGLSSTISNSLPASTVTMDFITGIGLFRWTNKTPANVVAYINTIRCSVGYNGSYIAGPVTNGCVTVVLKPGSYISVTNYIPVGSSIFAWHPF